MRPYTTWSTADWAALQPTINRLLQELDTQVRIRADRESVTFIELRELLRDLQQVSKSRDEVPFGPFEKSFRRGEIGQRIRVLLNWELLRQQTDSGAGRIRVHHEWSIAWLESHEIFSVWYATTENTFAEYYSDDVHPIRFHDIDDYFDNLPEHSRATIDSMAGALEVRSHGSLPQVAIVTIKLPMNRLLVIDGNHRIAAICRSRPNRTGPITATIVEYRIEAPIDPDLLPDLSHHQEVDTPA